MRIRNFARRLSSVSSIRSTASELPSTAWTPDFWIGKTAPSCIYLPQPRLHGKPAFGRSQDLISIPSFLLVPIAIVVMLLASSTQASSAAAPPLTALQAEAMFTQAVITWSAPGDFGRRLVAREIVRHHLRAACHRDGRTRGSLFLCEMRWTSGRCSSRLGGHAYGHITAYRLAKVDLLLRCTDPPETND